MRWTDLRLPLLLPLALAACGGSGSTTIPPNPPGRSWRMGFSAFPPAPDLTRATQALALWVPRADAAIAHIEPPWKDLLAGRPADSLVLESQGGVAAYYRQRGLPLVVTIDVTNGIDRTREAAELDSLGRSITEPAVQAAYQRYVLAVAAQLQPVALGLAAETNLIRIAAPPAVYGAVVAMTNATAAAVRRQAPGLPLYVSVQVETAWGRLQGAPGYVGIAQDLADFPFVQLLGLSSYPYLGGFAQPEDVPDDWYSRLPGASGLPVFVSEGGWTSVDVSATVTSSPEKQVRWLRRQARLLDLARARYLFQLDFTDLDLVAFGSENDPRVLPFARIGLVDPLLVPKPALAVWDSLFAVRRSP